MAKLNKKQQELLEQMKTGTYKSQREKQMEKRDANLRKQQAEADIAPVKNSTNNNIAPVKKDDGNWFTNLVKNTVKPSEYFSDGYQFGDITKTAGKTIGHIGSSIIEGGYSVVEGLTDLKKQAQALQTDVTTSITQKILSGAIQKKTGMNEESANALSGIASNVIGSTSLKNQTQGKYSSSEELRKSAIESDWDNSFAGDIQDKLREGSVAGSTTEKLGNLVGYTGASVLGGKALGKAGEITLKVGGKYLNMPTLAITTGTAQSLNESYNEDPDVSNVTAWSRGITSGLIEGATEGLFSFLGVGGSSLDEIGEKALKEMSEGMGKALASYGIPATGEALEELIGYTGNQLADLVVDKADGTTDFHKDWDWAEVGESMVLAFVSTGISQGGSSVANAVMQNVDVNKAVKQAEEQLGRKLTNEEKAEIKQQIKSYEEIAPVQQTEQQLQELQQTRVEKEAELKQSQDEREQQIIQEEIEVIDEELSSMQQDLKQKAFTYESNETDSEYKKAVYESAKQVNMNNTEASHKLADAVAKISEERKTTYLFVDNQTLEAMGHKIEGKTINGLVDKDGAVLLNIESEKLVNRVLGHETTHLLEGTKEYDELREIAIEFAKTTGDYQSRLDSLNSLYEGRNADIEAELTADIVGDYLFTSEQFVKELSVQKPTIFQKIKELISDLVVKFKGTKQEKQLRELQRKFENAYRNTDSKVSETSKNVIDVDNQGRQLTDEQRSYFKDSKVRDKDGNLQTVYHGTRGDFNVFETKRTGQNYDGDYSSLGRGSYFTSDMKVAKDFGESSTNEGDLNIKETYIDIKNPFYADEMTRNDSKVLEEISEKYDISESDLYDGYNLVRILRSKGVDSTEVLQSYGYDGIIAEDEYVVFDSNQVKNVDNVKPTTNPDTRYSLSEEQEIPLNERLSGDDLLNAEDLIYEIEDIAEVSPNGYVTLYHRTSQANANEIYKTGKMSAKEDGVFFSTKNAGSQATGFGDSVVKVKVPVEKLVLDDLFSDEAHLKIPLKNKNEVLDVSQYLIRDKMSLSNKDEQTAPTGDFDISSEDIKLQIQEAIAPMEELVTDLVEQMKTIAPVQDAKIEENAPYETQDAHVPVKTEINKKGVQMGIGDQVRTFNNSIYEVTDFFTLDDGIVRVRLRNDKGYETSIGIDSIDENLSDPTKNNVSRLVENDSLQSSEAVEKQGTEDFNNMGDVPPSFEDAFEEAFSDLTEDDFEHKTTVESPLADRNIEDVGNRKVKAYQYENPEVRPFFQAEAQNMLYDLENTIKGEKIAIKDEEGYITDWAGVSRQTTEAIAYLKDTWGYSYAQIEKGLKDIIEDNGKENNAVAKRIEFLLDERLREGYTASDGIQMPVNEDYVKFLEERQITEYNRQALDSLAVDENVPVEEIIEAPVKTSENTQISNETQEVIKDVAPVENVPQNPNTEAVEGKQRSWATTSTESESIKGKIQLSDLDVEKINYIPITNEGTLEKVNKKIDTEGYDKSINEFKASMISGKNIKAEDVTLGQRLIQEALKRGDKDTAIDLLQDVTIMGTELGQAVQALSIIQRMTPAGQLKMLEKTVNRAKAKGDKSFENVEITKEMKEKILDSFNDDGVTYDQDKLNRTMDEVKQELAKQIKATKLDKVNAWRYLSMLGNPRTHIRNMVSNVAMWGTTEVKNIVARTGETIGSTIAPSKFETRTKTFKPSSQEVIDFANQTTAEMKDIISGDNKYNDETGIKNLAKTFESEILEKAYNFNNDLLQKEDWWFSGARFKQSLSEFLTANNINTEEDIFLNPELVEKGKAYALKQSQIATFRQVSYLANKIREIENKNVATNIAVGSVIPFKKTPINVAKAGLSYSPLGLVKSLSYDIAQVIQYEKTNGEKGIPASQLVDNVAQGLTGTGLALLGYMLAMSGFLSGAGEDDEESKYDYQLGKQSYAINIGGKSYSLSWLSPVAMPLFVGANMYEQLVEDKEWNGDVVVETLAQTLDPLNEMSFVSGLVDILSSYDSGTQAISGMLEAMGQNYTTQFFPTLGSQVASVMDDTKRTTKVASDSDFKFVDETVNKIMLKVPVLRQLLEPSTDIWGNEVKQTENILQRALETFIAPYSAKESTATEIDENIKSVFSATGDNGVIPNVPKNTIKFNNETYKMSAEEYTDFKKTYGQTANDLLEDLFRTTTYKTAGADEKAEMINEVYDYASDIAKKKQLATEGVTYTNTTEDGEKVYKENTIKEAIKNDMTKEEYKLYSDDPEEYKFLEGKDTSYKRKYFNTSKGISEIEKTFKKKKDAIEVENMDEDEYKETMEELSNEQKRSVVNEIINSGLEDTEKASLYKRYYNSDTVDTIVKSSINVDDYLTYTATEFKADYKSDGKVISGSRKKKVIEYINSLDMNIPQKAILIKSTNTFKFNDYNNEIVDYVDTLDITFDEKKSILKDLDMTIDEDGYVYWK